MKSINIFNFLLFVLAPVIQINSTPFAIDQVININNQIPAYSNLSTADSIEIIQVPGDVNNIQDAINQISDNGIIEISSGVYQTPAQGFSILALNKNFTIRAKAGANVIFNGNGNNRILNIQEIPSNPADSINFEKITFKDGFTNINGAGAITIMKMNVTFDNCVFQNNRKNHSSSGTVGGAVSIGMDSTVFFLNSIFVDNASEDGGAGIGAHDSNVYIHASIFTNNQTTDICSSCVPNGAAINAGNTKLQITNSRFEGNKSAGHGAAVSLIGEWNKPKSNVIIANVSFIQNMIDRNTPQPHPIEGGALVVEDHVNLKIYNSRFIKNSASIGGGLSIFRSNSEIYKSVFRGNRATDTTASSGFGGAINFNPHNRPDYSRLIIEDSFIQGKYDGVSTVAQFGGGISTAASLVSPFAEISLSRVVLNDLDVTTQSGLSKPGIGGGISVGENILTMEDSLIMNSDATGPEGGVGGGIAVYPNTDIHIQSSIFASNTSDTFGGALFAQASSIEVTNSIFQENEISPLQSEPGNSSYGAAIFTAPEDPTNIPVTGTVENSTFVENIGLAIFDDDRQDGPINDVRYNQNEFFETTFGDDIYKDSLTATSSVSNLNDLVVSRASAVPTTDKSQVNNVELSNSPRILRIMAIPPIILQETAVGDPASFSKSFIAYVWNGSSASINGSPLSNQAWFLETSTPASYSLSVDGSQSIVNVTQGQNPTLSIDVLYSDTGAEVNWNCSEGSFLDIVMDQGINISSSPSGSVQIPSSGNSYHLYMITEEGGYSRKINTDDPSLLLFLPFMITD